MELVQTVVAGWYRGSRVQTLIDSNHLRAGSGSIAAKVVLGEERVVVAVFPDLSHTIQLDRSSQTCMDHTYTLVRSPGLLKMTHTQCSKSKAYDLVGRFRGGAFCQLSPLRLQALDLLRNTFPRGFLFQTSCFECLYSAVKSCSHSIRKIRLELVEVLV